MKRVLLLAVLSLVASLQVKAQVVYTDPSPYLCKAASLQPVYPFSNFMCWGIQVEDGNGNTGAFYFMGNGRVEVWLPGTIPGGLTLGTLTLTSFTPTEQFEACNGTVTGSTPGTFTFDWSVVDVNGTTHTGTVTSTWIDKQVAGGNGCKWHHPKLLTFSTTVN